MCFRRLDLADLCRMRPRREKPRSIAKSASAGTLTFILYRNQRSYKVSLGLFDTEMDEKWDDDSDLAPICGEHA